MGADLNIGLVDDEQEKELEAPFVPRSFLREIVFESYLSLEEVLSHEEYTCFKPDYISFEPRSEIPRQPLKLAKALGKVNQYMIENADRLPLVHQLQEREEDFDVDNLLHFGTSPSIWVSGVKCQFEGDNQKWELRKQANVRSYLGDYGKVDFWIQVQPVVYIDQKRYFIRTITKAEQYQAVFDQLITFCQKAHDLHRKVYWSWDN